MDKHCAVLDTDFLNLITNYRDGDPIDLFQRIMQGLDCSPVLHPYVAEHELNQNRIAMQLIDRGLVQVIPYESFLNRDDELETMMYRRNFEDLHNAITEDIESKYGSSEVKKLESNTNIFQRHAQMSFGEVHSLLMAAELQIPILYSNDHGAVIAARRFPPNRIEVLNAEKVATSLEGKTEVSSKERRYLRKYKDRIRAGRQ